MKKIILLASLICFSVSSFAEVLVYKCHYKTQTYTMKSGQNTRSPRLVYAYLVLNYDPNTTLFTEPTMVIYWQENKEKYMQTIPYAGNVLEILTPNTAGRRVVMNAFVDSTDNKSYSFIDSTRNMMKNQLGTIGSPMPFTPGFKGAEIYETAMPLGGKILQSSSMNAYIVSSLTKEYINGSVGSAVSAIETMVKNWGYRAIL